MPQYQRANQFVEVSIGDQRTDIDALATTVVKAGPGKIGHILVWDDGATGTTIKVFDHPSAANNQVFLWTEGVDATGLFAIQCPMENGITIVTATGTAAKFAVVWS